MRLSIRCLWLLTACGLVFLSVSPVAGDKAPQTGSATEKRFPPLRVPAQFKATLFACDPLIEYPSAVALGPRPGTIFVAVDYMTGLGTEIVRRDEIRLVEDSDGDGYADKATVFAKGFNSIQGLTYHDGTLYVMHAPYLTALRDTTGRGVADRREDLLSGLGLTPEENPVRLHCANGLVMGHDGWLYLALGDHGCKVTRPEGDRLVLEGGGILRCRPNGRDLHVFATGLRNIYDVALDAELNVFVRDNENDGGTYMIRVCHSFFGADHGYPYLYEERPEEALAPLADLGLGSSAGGLCYLETQFPAAYQGNLFFCEWGRAVVRYPLHRAGSAFAPVKEFDFATGAANDPYGFKPTDLVVERDGSLIVVDWADDQRPKRGRGRIYRITHVGKGGKAPPFKPLPRDADLARCVKQLDSPSYYARCDAQAALERRGKEGIKAVQEALSKDQPGVRGRLHAVWLLARVGGPAFLDQLFDLARSDPDSAVQAQAIRAIADLSDPVLTRHRLDAGAGDPAIAARLAKLGRAENQRILREVVIALGRLRWAETHTFLRQNLTKPDAPLAHAAMQALRRARNWPAVLRLLDRSSTEPLRSVALRACADRFVPELVDGLVERLRAEQGAGRRQEYADLLTRVYKKPGPWTYWGYRPPPRPANSALWERTEAIASALDRALGDPDRSVRLAILKRMQREKGPAGLATLSRWLGEDRQADRVAAILESLRDRPGDDVRALFLTVARERAHTPAIRQAALAHFAARLNSAEDKQLVDLASALEDGPVLSAALRYLGKRPRAGAGPLLLRKLKAPVAEVRASALEALAEMETAVPEASVFQLLQDKDARVRRAAAALAGRMKTKSAADLLLKLAKDADGLVRQASLAALASLRESRALPLALSALADRETEMAALECIGVLGGPEHGANIAKAATDSPSSEMIAKAVSLLVKWSEPDKSILDKNELADQRRLLLERVYRIQGATGALMFWSVWGPYEPALPPDALDLERQSPRAKKGFEYGRRRLLAGGSDALLTLDQGKQAEEGASWLAQTGVVVPEQAEVQFLAGFRGTLKVWVNGRLVYKREKAREFRLDSDRFPVTLRRGTSHVQVWASAPKAPVQLQMRFRRTSSRADHEKLFQAALTSAGDPRRGRAVFFNAEKSQCLKCHRLGDEGERIGPELTGVGSRFSRSHIIESILEPSRTIAPSYQTWLIVLKNGRQLQGVKAAQTATALVLGDRDGKKHEIPRADIDEERPLPQSTMPDGLEQRLTREEFTDLIAFLVSQKRGQGKGAGRAR
jgi:putative membrane-bound dehydrogenase-like protein